MDEAERPCLTLVVCAAPLARRAPDVAASLVSAGWRVRVVVTPTAVEWVDGDAVRSGTGSSVVVSQRKPSEERTWPEDRATVVAPLTFNSLNKWAAGISDNYALGVLNESVAVGRPTVAVPVVGGRFWNHPARVRSMEVLESAGVRFMDDSGGPDDFDVEQLVLALSRLDVHRGE